MSPEFETRIALIEELEGCIALRARVFVKELGVPLELELDGEDSNSLHFLVIRQQAILGTARLRSIGDQARIERVAVERAWRGRGLGASLMKEIEAEAARRGFVLVSLHAQCAAEDFYLRLGYLPYGERFMDAGIPHRAMSKRLLTP